MPLTRSRSLPRSRARPPSARAKSSRLTAPSRITPKASMPWVWAATGSAGIDRSGRSARADRQTAPRPASGRPRPRGCARPGVERVEAADELGAERRQVGLRDHQGIGDRGLPPRLGKAVEAVGAGDRIDQRHDPRQMQTMVEHRVGAEREQDRRRVGEPAGLDDDPAKPRGSRRRRAGRAGCAGSAPDPRAPRSTGSRRAIRARCPRRNRRGDGRSRSRRSR